MNFIGLSLKARVRMDKLVMDMLKEAIGHLKDARICLLRARSTGIYNNIIITNADGFIVETLDELSYIHELNMVKSEVEDDK